MDAYGNGQPTGGDEGSGRAPEPDGVEAAPDEVDAAPDEVDAAPTPGLARRLVDVVFSPGRAANVLAEDPKWVGALLLAAVLLGLQMGLIPADVFASAQRQALLDAGREAPELPERAIAVIRIVTPIVTALSTAIFTFIFAGVYTLVFAFILGDEGRYRQYLAITAHAWFIPAVVGLCLTPLRISAADPQLSLNLGSFLFFLPEGYLYNLFRVLDLTQIWAMLVVAHGAHAIDAKRSFGSAASILLGILLAVALVVARFLPT